MYVMPLFPGVTPTRTSVMAAPIVVPCVGCVSVRRASSVTQWTDSLTRWCHGVCPTRATGTTTGPDCTDVWSGRASLAPQSPTLNPWANRWVNSCCILHQQLQLQATTWVFVYRIPDSFPSVSHWPDLTLLTYWHQFYINVENFSLVEDCFW